MTGDTVFILYSMAQNIQIWFFIRGWKKRFFQNQPGIISWLDSPKPILFCIWNESLNQKNIVFTLKDIYWICQRLNPLFLFLRESNQCSNFSVKSFVLMFDLRQIFDLRKIFAVPKDFLKSKIYCIEIQYLMKYLTLCQCFDPILQHWLLN